MDKPVKKIVFFCEFPLDKRIFKSLGIDILIANNYDVEFWDVTPYFHKTFFTKITRMGDVEFEGYKKFHTKRDIVHALSMMPAETVVIMQMLLQLETLFIYRYLSVNNIKYCVLQMIYLPTISLPKQGLSLDFLKSFQKRLCSLKPLHAVAGFFNIILFRYYYLFNVRPADLALLSGEKSLEIIRDPIDGNTRLIWSHAEDYDTYLEERVVEVEPDPRLGVFLDEYYPLHTDVDYLGISSPISVEEYYSKLRSFFDYLEKTYNVHIVIAAHPRSDYSESTDYFGSRSVLKGQTARLVHESAFVLVHDSTSINFAVLFKKPVIFITMEKMEKCDAGRLTTALSIKAMSDALRKKPINLDAPCTFDWQDELTVDNEAYEKYANDVIHKNGVPDIPSGEIFVQRLKEIYG